MQSSRRLSPSFSPPRVRALLPVCTSAESRPGRERSAMLESRTRRGVHASWLVAICVSVGLTTTTSSAASVPCHPGCNIVGGYCGPSGGCRCRPGWTGALCDTRRPRPLSSSPTPGAHRCNTDTTTTTTTTTTTMTTSMGDQPLCPGHGSPCVAGGPGESGCPPREDPCSTPGSPREVTTSTRGCQQPHVSPLTTFTSQTPSHQPQQQQQPPPQQQQQPQTNGNFNIRESNIEQPSSISRHRCRSYLSDLRPRSSAAAR
ncbi:uncharacterized protein LOC144943358 [Lampetra fluviatilis]